MPKIVTAQGKKFTFDDNTTDEEIASAIDYYFSTEKKKPSSAGGKVDTMESTGQQGQEKDILSELQFDKETYTPIKSKLPAPTKGTGLVGEDAPKGYVETPPAPKIQPTKPVAPATDMPDYGKQYEQAAEIKVADKQIKINKAEDTIKLQTDIAKSYDMELPEYRNYIEKDLANYFLDESELAEYNLQQSLDEYVNLSKDLNPNDINNKDIFNKISSLKKDAANLRVQKVNGVVEQIRQIKESIDYTDPTETKEKLEEIKKLRATINPTINPVQYAKEKASTPEVLEMPGDTPMDKLKNYYHSKLYELKKLEEDTGFLDYATGSLPIVGDLTGATKKRDKYRELYQEVKELTPIITINQKDLKEDNFFTQFAKATVGSLLSSNIVTTEQEQADKLYSAFKDADVMYNISEEAKQAIDASFDMTLKEEIGSTGGVVLGMMPAFVTGGAAVKGAGSLAKGTKIADALTKLDKSSRAAKYLIGATETGLSYEAAGLLSTSEVVDEEASFLSGFMGETFVRGLGKLVPQKIYNQTMLKLFGGSANKAQDLLMKGSARVGSKAGYGFGEVAEEYGNELGNIISESNGDLNEFIKMHSERFGNFDENVKFGLMTFGMGMAFGTFTNSGKDFMKKHQEWLSEQSPEVQSEFATIAAETQSAVDEISGTDAVEDELTKVQNRINQIESAREQGALLEDEEPGELKKLKEQETQLLSKEEDATQAAVDEVAIDEEGDIQIGEDELSQLEYDIQQQEDQGTILDNIDQTVYMDGKEGVIKIDPENENTIVFESGNTVRELGNKDEVGGNLLASVGISLNATEDVITDEKVTTGEKQKSIDTFTLDGKEYNVIGRKRDKKGQAVVRVKEVETGLERRIVGDNAEVILKDEALRRGGKQVTISEMKVADRVVEPQTETKAQKRERAIAKKKEFEAMNQIEFDAAVEQSNKDVAEFEEMVVANLAAEKESNKDLVSVSSQVYQVTKNNDNSFSVSKMRTDGKLTRVTDVAERSKAVGQFKRAKTNKEKAKLKEADTLLSDFKKEESDKILSLLDRLIDSTNIKGRAFDATLGIPMVTVNASLRIVRAAYKASKSLAEAIADGIRYLKENGYAVNELDYKKYVLSEFKKKPYSTPEKKPTTQATEKVADVETQVQDFGVGEDDVKPVVSVISKIFNTLKSAGLTASKTVSDWVGIGKGTEKPYTLKINGKDVEVKNINEDVVNGFYSQLTRAISSSKQDKMPAKQWIDKFANNEEARWTGLKDWLSNQQGSVSKSDIQQYLKDNRISVVEVVKGGKEGIKEQREYAKKRMEDMGYENVTEEDIDNFLSGSKDEDNTKFSQYQLEGEKENYKEILVTMPTLEGSKQAEYDNYYKSLIAKYGESGWTGYALRYKFSEEEKQKLDSLKPNEDLTFKSSHFDEPNILVHLRMNTRTDADGNKVLFLEEVQSDWGQEGKKKGFESPERKDTDKKIAELWDKEKEADSNLTKLMRKAREGTRYWTSVSEQIYLGNKEVEQAHNAVKEIQKQRMTLVDSIRSVNGGVINPIPAAPFVMDTNDWAKLGLKVALKEAVAQGATKIAWTTGEQQNDRYDLRKQVDEIGYSYNKKDNTYRIVGGKGGSTTFNSELKESELESNLGKDAASKIIADKDNSIGKMNFLRGDDLAVGGKGMKGFYGSPTEGSLGIVGGVAKKLFKQVPKTVSVVTGISEGGKYVESDYEVRKDETGYYIFDTYDEIKIVKSQEKGWETKEEADKFANSTYDSEKILSTQYSIDITPELKAQVEEGQQLFKDAEAQYRIENGKNLIEAIKSFDGSAKAVVAITHEIMHPTVVAIIDGARDKNKVGLKHTKTIIDEFNKANPKNKVNLAELIAGNDSFKAGDTTSKYRAVQEFIAESFERYNTEGAKGFSKSFQEVLEQIKKAFQEVYTTITGKDLSPELRSMFDEILGKNQSTLKDAKEPGYRIITKAREILFKGMQPKIKDGKNFSAHEIKEGEFAALDIKLAMDYKGLLPLKQFSIPAGTTVDVVKLAPEDSKKGMLAARKIETDAIDASDAQVVKLLTYDSRGGVSEQYIIKDKSILSGSKDVTDSQLKSRLASLKGKIPTEIKRIFDKVKNIKEITYVEQQAIVDQIISDQSDIAQVSESIMQELVELEGKGKISQKQSNAIVSRMSKLDKLDEVKVAKFIDYASKILNDANYKFKVDAVAAKLKKAKLNIPRRLGINKAGGIVKRLLTMDMNLVPKEVFDKYTELVELMASSSSIIEINKDIDEIARIAQEVLSAVEIENGKLQQLAEVYKENKSDKLTYTQNLDKMLVAGIINTNDKEIMSKYKSIIDKKPAVKKTKAEIEEEKKELVKDILSETKSKTRVFATRAETDLAIQIKKLATKENMDLLSVAQLKTLSKVISNINNGLVDRNTFMLRNRLNANNSIQPVYESTIKAKIGRIANYFHLLKPKTKGGRFGMGGEMSATTSAIRHAPGFNIDVELGNYKTRELWENLLERLAIGENLDDTKVNTIVTQADKVMDKIYKSFFRRENRLVESKAKMFLYKLGLEFKSNPDSDQVKSPEAYLKKTINDSNLDKRTKKMLSDILNDKKIFIDGVLDLDKLYSSFNKYEKEFIALAGKINQEASEYAMFDAGIIQDRPITLLNDYVHHIVIKEDVTVSNDTAADMADKISRSMTPSTRAEHLTDREDVVTPLNFDLYNSLVTGVKKTYLAYYMTEPIMTSRLVLEGLKAKMIEDGTFEKNKDVFQALNEKVEEGIANLLYYNMASNSIVDEIANQIGTEAYRYILASDQKIFAEVAGAISYIALNKPNTYAAGVKAINKITMEEFAAIATNAKSIHLTKFLTKNVLYASRLVESSSSKSGTASKKTKSKAGDYSKLLYNQTLKRARNVSGAINDFTITTADKYLNLPLWYGSFRSEFKKVSGEELDKNKFVANDLEYVQKYENAIEAARRHADEVITDATSVKGKFSGKLSGKDFSRIKTDILTKTLTYVNEFMAGFMQGETNALIKGVRASMGSGRKGMSKADGTRLAAAVLARSISYNVVIATTAGGIFYAIYKSLNDLEDDKYEEELSVETLAEATKKAAIAAVSGRAGNVPKIAVNLAGEYINREYFYDGPEEEYKYLTYLPKPDKMGWETTSLYDYAPAFAGVYGVGFKTANEAFVLNQEEDKLNKKETYGMNYSKKMELKSKKNNMPYRKLAIGVSILGQMGLVPLGKNVAKIAKKEAYRDK